MNGPNVIYAIQSCFTGGEISPDVASRVDLEKYQTALLQAENMIIRPYGAAKKRPGTVYCGAVKIASSPAILLKFTFSVSVTYMLEIGAGYIRIWRNGVYLGVELETPYTADDLETLRTVQSMDVMYIVCPNHPVKKLARYTEKNWAVLDIDWSRPAFGDLNPDEANKITPSGTSGSITLTSTSAAFTDAQAGDWIEIQQEVGGAETYCSGGTSSSIAVGDSWKIITHGTWTGTVILQRSNDDGKTWIQERHYTGANDFNPSESGTVEEYCLMRLTISISSGSISANLSAYPYTHYGYAKLTSISSSTSASASVVDNLASTEATENWKLGAWRKENGYPACITFFQDRLCFAGSEKFPLRVWMSRTGDYENFGVEKESGTVTDDSAITADLLSMQCYKIVHMQAGNDLILLTEGNEWTISGAETVKPSSITPRNQQNYGANDVWPIRVGNRIVYVQRRGSIVRDMGYAYDTDSYGGMDLTLLAKNLIKGHTITSSAFAQEPDSLIYFVRDDGVLLVLTYIIEQKVYAWSHFVTDGEFESICTVPDGNNDILYAIVKRTINGNTARYIERFDIDRDSVSQSDYTMMDCASVYVNDAAVSTVNGLDYLEGKTVCVMGDGYLFENKTVKNGSISIEQAAKKITVGLPYSMTLEQPNYEVQLQDGSVQGRKKNVAFAIVRMENSFGGTIGPDKDHQSPIVYEVGNMELGGNVLYSGDKQVRLAVGGFNTNGRAYIKQDTPYPFTVSAIIRGVVLSDRGI